MKSKLLALFLVISQSTFIVEMHAAAVDSRITAVTVYLDRAIVTRTATATLAAGEQTLVFENLPTALVDQSLQASGRGVAGATILDVTAESVFSETAPNDRVKALEEQIKGLQKQRRVLDDKAKILEEQRSFVQRMLQASTGSVPSGARGAANPVEIGRPSLDEWQKLFSYSEETFGKIATELQSLDNQREELQAKQTVLEKQLNELRGARGKQSKTVKVRLSLATAGKLDVAVRYAIPNASWNPTYDARLRSTDRTVELTYFGTVRNGTGEDWKDVALTLSTARPNLGGGAPELRPWIADRIQGSQLPMVTGNVLEQLAVLPGFRGGAAGAASQTFNASPRSEMRADKEAKDEAAAGVLAATVETGVSSATFKIPVTVSVPGNNVNQKVAINSVKLAASLQFQSTPKVLEAAFLSAYANNTSEYFLLPGPMNTFLDDTFVAASNLKTVAPGEKFELALGADEGISIKRRLVNRFTEDVGMSNKTRRVTYQFLVTITNNKTTTEHIVFKEPTPVSRDEKIAVKIQIPSEKEIGTPTNQKEVTKEEDGKLVWRVDLKAGEKREFPLKLSIEHPIDMAVTGVE